jgi:hypothetical protein
VTDTPVKVQPTRKLSGPALIAALLGLVLWAAFVIIMTVRAGSANDLLWARLAFLFASVEAVAFAAGGALWGASIQRDRAEKAETAAERNSTAAANGRALAKAVEVDGRDASGAPTPPGVQALGAEASDLAERHARLARALFPDI